MNNEINNENLTIEQNNNEVVVKSERSRAKKASKSNGFLKFILIYIIAALVLICFCLIYVKNILILYENSQLVNVKNKIIEDIKKDITNKEFKYNYVFASEKINEKENSTLTLKDGLKNAYDNHTITYEMVDEDTNNPGFLVYKDDEMFGNVVLEKKNEMTKLGLIKIIDWGVKEYDVNNKQGFYYYDMYIPNNCKLLINNILVDTSKDTICEQYNEALTILSNHTTIPYTYYHIENHFIKDPKIVVTNDKNEEVEYTKDKHTIKCKDQIIRVNTLEEAKKYLLGNPDPLTTAKKWSLFLTNDLNGGRHGGLSEIRKYILPNTALMQFAQNWTYGIESTWVSVHSLENPPFQSEKVSNFEIYTNKAYSCEVELVKRIHINVSWKVKEDVMHERMYFCYDENTKLWYLTSMQSLAKK